MPQLTWLGDAEAKRAARRVPYRLLDPIEQVGDPAAQNMLIQGDNLDALKALMPFYAGRVKCIFIDPPYNTKSAFEHYDDNLEHSQWLSMMYPRLALLHDLLSEDGSIWIHLDDNETHYSKVVVDEICGRRNFIADIAWQKSYAVRSNAEFFSTSVERISVFSRNRSAFALNNFPRTDAQRARFTNPDDDPRGPWQSITMTISLMAGARGRQFERTGESSNIFEVSSPSGKRFTPPARRCWSRGLEDFQRLNADKRIWWGPRGDSPPRMKMFLSESSDEIVPTTLWASGEQFGFNQDGVREVRALGLEFPTPKPERLVSQIIGLATNPGDLVLDSFLGSGTTAAVAHKMGRHWIGIEMGEHARTHCLPRLKKVVDGEKGGISAAVGWKGGGGFRYYQLGERAFDESGRIHPAIRFATLAAYLWFLDTGAPHPAGRFDAPLLGVHGDTASFLLYNGILGDRRPDGGNVLTRQVLDHLVALTPTHRGPRVVYGEASRLSKGSLKDAGVDFRQIPYEIRMR